ncbi:type II toxin-antitoxin system RelE/ParE family toxin [Rhizobium leguminosarum]|uniref:type II toxin-antitoxin system RelE/ParE family toxin n=1 Tax=Rhizobium leguminosarum TaxID=384 RepID=UPI003F9DA0F5
MRLTVKPAARNDILLQLAYLAEHGGEELGLRFLHATEQSFTRLLDYPHSGTPKTFVNSHLTGVRSWPVSGFEDIRLIISLRVKQLRSCAFCTAAGMFIGILGED